MAESNWVDDFVGIMQGATGVLQGVQGVLKPATTVGANAPKPAQVETQTAQPGSSTVLIVVVIVAALLLLE